MTKNHKPLFASHEKIKRAKTKFGYLKSAINRYIDGNPLSLIQKSDAQHRYVVCRRLQDIPEDVAWETVEAVGHLRSALDKALIDLVEFNGRGASGVGYPFGGIGPDGKPDIFPTARHDHLKKKLTPEQWGLIIAQQPYPGGNDTLWSINEIANADKHRKGLVAVSGCARPGDFRVLFHTVLPSEVDVIHSFPDIGEYNAILDNPETDQVILVTGHGNKNLKIEQGVTVGVVFSDLPPVTSKEVLVTLNQQIRLVEGIVGIFERTFFTA